MPRRVEIQTAGAGLAVVEIWLVTTNRISRTSMTEPMPREAARRHAHSLGLEVIDHTEPIIANARDRALRRMQQGEWRPS